MRLLVCSYYFPPIGGAGSQRPAKFVRHFDALGHRCTVLTGPGEPRSRWTPADPTLTMDVPRSVEVLRVQGSEPAPPRQLRAKLERWMPIRREWSRWWIDGAIQTGVRAVPDADVIYTIMSPFDSAEVSRNLALHLGVPWVADLGDPWALDEMAVFPTGLHRRLELRRMRRLLRSAAAIVMSTPEAAAELLRVFPELAAKPVLAIPNGYDAADFAVPVPAREDAMFRIVHSGYLHTDLGLRQRRTRLLRRLLGGQLKGVEILPRSHVYLLKALEQLFERDPGLKDRVEVVLAGVLSDADRSLIADLPFVRTPGYLTHNDSLALVRSADLLFLPMQKLPTGRRSTTVPGKTYEYLASGRPVLAAVPEGDARDILIAAGTAQICDPDDTDAMTQTIREQLDLDFKPGLRAEKLEQFEYRNLARQAAELVEQLIQVSNRPAPRRAKSAPVRPEPDPRPLRVLRLAYPGPPTGGAGSQRTAKLVRYLDREVYVPIILSGPGPARGRWTPVDGTMTNDIPPGTRVVRIDTPEPTSSVWQTRLERWANTPSPWGKWWQDGLAAKARGVGNFDFIYASMAPFDSAPVAARIAAERGVPWIAGLRDPWALDEMAVFPTGLHRRLELRRMRRLLRSAAAIVMSTPEAAAELLRVFPELAAKPVLAIPNGYDAADFAVSVPAREDVMFRIVHSGYLHTDLGLRQRRTRLLRRLLGGQLKGVEILPRSHVYLLKALEQLFERDPGLKDRVEVVLAGVLSDADRSLIADLPFVRTPGYLTHNDSLALVRSADLLFLPMQKLPTGRRSTTVPGKTYEYLASGRPVLAAVPEGDARDILIAAGTAQICDPDDTDAMTQALENAARRWERGEISPDPDPSVVERYDRARIADDFAQAFDRALGINTGPKGGRVAEEQL